MSSLVAFSRHARVRLGALAVLLLAGNVGIALSALAGAGWLFLISIVAAHLIDLLVEDVPAPDEPDAMTRFDRAVGRAVCSAEETWPVRPMVDATA